MFEQIKSIDWSESLPVMPAGSVALVGAGPGDPLLISLRAAVRIIQADVVVYDALANEALLQLSRDGAERIYVGKRAGAHKMGQEQINDLLVELGKAGKRVARLKGGDPLIFGRGSEEAERLREAGITFEIVPGITAAAGAAAYAGIPLTDRRFTSTLTFVTGHEDPTKEDSTVDYAALAKMGSIVLYMGLRTLPQHAKAPHGGWDGTGHPGGGGQPGDLAAAAVGGRDDPEHRWQGGGRGDHRPCPHADRRGCQPARTSELVRAVAAVPAKRSPSLGRGTKPLPWRGN